MCGRSHRSPMNLMQFPLHHLRLQRTYGLSIEAGALFHALQAETDQLHVSIQHNETSTIQAQCFPVPNDKNWIRKDAFHHFSLEYTRCIPSANRMVYPHQGSLLPCQGAEIILRMQSFGCYSKFE